MIIFPTPASIAPAVPLIDESPTIKGVVIPPPCLIVTAPSPTPACPTLQMLATAPLKQKLLVGTRNRFPALIVIAPLLPGYDP